MEACPKDRPVLMLGVVHDRENSCDIGDGDPEWAVCSWYARGKEWLVSCCGFVMTPITWRPLPAHRPTRLANSNEERQ